MKENSFAQYINKQKLKGNYTSQLDESVLDEGIGDFLKKDWYNTKKHLSGNLKDDEIELYRITGDFSDKAFRDAVIGKCVKAVQEKAKEEAAKASKDGDEKLGTSKLKEILEEIEPEKIEKIAQPAIQETIKKIINQVVGLAKGINSNYDDNSEDLEKDDNLYNGKSKGYKYSWVQKDKLYIYFDSEKAARDFLREDLKEQKHLELDESVISKMFSIEKCIRNKGKVYDKVETEKRHYKKESPIPHSKFDEECSKIIFDKIKDELVKNAKDARYGKKVSVGRITWSWPDDEIKKFLEKCVKEGVKDSAGLDEKLADMFKKIVDAAEKSGHFLYAKGTAKGNVNLNFETLGDAETFKDNFEDEISDGILSAAADGKSNSKFIEQAKTGDKKITAAKLKAKIIVMADEYFDQIKISEEEAAAAEAKLGKEGKAVETFAVTASINSGELDTATEDCIKSKGNGSSVEAADFLEYILVQGGDIEKYLANNDDFCYAEIASNGDITLHFETERSAEKFINDYNGGAKHQIFKLSSAEESKANSKNIEEFVSNGKKIQKQKVEKVIEDHISDKYASYIKGLAAADLKGSVVEIGIFPDMNTIMTKIGKVGSAFINQIIHNGSALREAAISAFNTVLKPITLCLIDEDTAAKKPATFASLTAGLDPETKKQIIASYKKFKSEHDQQPPTASTIKKWIKNANGNAPTSTSASASASAPASTSTNAESNSDTSTSNTMDPDEVLNMIQIALIKGIEDLDNIKAVGKDKVEIKKHPNGVVIRFNNVSVDDIKNIKKQVEERLIEPTAFSIKTSTAGYKKK